MRRLRSALIAYCLLAASAAAPAAPPAAPAPGAPLSLCFERVEVLPWRTLDGKGLNFELLNEAAHRLNIRFDYESMPWKRCLAQLKANQVDGAFAASFSRERLALGAYPGGEQADQTKRLHVDRYVLVRRKGTHVDWDGAHFANLDGRIGVQLGYSVADFLRAQNVPVDEGSQRYDELAQKLLAGRVAAAAMGGGDAVRLQHGPFASQVEVLPVPLIEKPYYLLLSHAFVEAHPGLAQRIWKTIEEVRNTPEFKKREREMMGGRH